jgi:hypothetical protein
MLPGNPHLSFAFVGLYLNPSVEFPEDLIRKIPNLNFDSFLRTMLPKASGDQEMTTRNYYVWEPKWTFPKMNQIPIHVDQTTILSRQNGKPIPTLIRLVNSSANWINDAIRPN